MKKFTIAIVCDPLTHLVAGSMISTIRFAAKLQERGHTIILITAQNGGPRGRSLWKGFRRYTFRSFILPGTSGQYPIAFAEKKSIRSILTEEAVEIVHTIDPTPLSMTAINAAKELGIKAVSHCHLQPENISCQFPRMLNFKKFNDLIYRYILWLYRKVDAVISPSEFGKTLLRNYDKDIRIEVVSNGVNLKKFRAERKTIHESEETQASMKDTVKKILFVGRLAGEKSVDTLVRALPLISSSLPETHLNIVGSGPLEAKLKNLALRLNMSKRITFHGHVDDEHLLRLYSESTIFCLPSIAELEGMVVLEAMACGKPILISDSKDSASPSFVKRNGLTFHAKDPVDLAEKALSLLSDPARCREMGAQSEEEVKRYDIEVSANKLEQLYNSI